MFTPKAIEKNITDITYEYNILKLKREVLQLCLQVLKNETNIVTQVSYTNSHPLSSGDPLEDDEMKARMSDHDRSLQPDDYLSCNSSVCSVDDYIHPSEAFRVEI